MNGKKRVLFTGSAGFIGSHTVDELCKRGYEVLGIDNFSTGKPENTISALLTGNYQMEYCDVNMKHHLEKHFHDFRPNFVFHYAAVVGVQKTLKDPVSVLDDIKGIENVCELSRKYKVNRLLFSSSSEVYGDAVEIPSNEYSTPLNSKLPYAVVKNVGEKYLETYSEKYGVDYNIFRFFNCYGTRQRDDFVVSKFIENAERNKPLTLYGSGKQSRTFMHVSDNVEACCNAIEHEIFKNNIYNIGYPRITSIKKLAKKIIEIAESDSEIHHVSPLSKGDMYRRQPDITQMAQLINPCNLKSLDEGLRETIQ